MTDEDIRWHRLLSQLEQLLGQEEAATLMEHLPSRPWHELATKQDLERFATKQDLERLTERFATKQDLESLKHEFTATLHKELSANVRLLFFSQMAMMMTLAGLAFGAARL
jgi:hypothetical protein